ncbi:MAG: hypothetical protein IJ725_05885, partial [Ruminococcus sp.]|nr:hypothetical protein [Ruminococcus sp.]
MKHITKSLSLIMALLVAFGSFMISPAAAGAADESKIYFDISGFKSFSRLFCHISERGGDSFFIRQGAKELCEKVSGTIYSYDLSNLLESDRLEGGIKSDKDYIVTFSTNTGYETYPLTMGAECAGDTVYMTYRQLENPIDCNKSVYEACWKTNDKKYGPHLTISSRGYLLGTILCPRETREMALGDWTALYYESININLVERLVELFPRLGIFTDERVRSLYYYIAANYPDVDLSRIGKALYEA